MDSISDTRVIDAAPTRGETVSCIWQQDINDKPMTLRLPLANKHHATIITAYAPTLTNPKKVIETFYEDLDKLIRYVPRQEKLFLLGDINARVGTDHMTWEGELEKTVSENATAMGYCC